MPLEAGMIKDLVVKNRNCRRFDQGLAISVETLPGGHCSSLKKGIVG
jgi:hypothetical protein